SAEAERSPAAAERLDLHAKHPRSLDRSARAWPPLVEPSRVQLGHVAVGDRIGSADVLSVESALASHARVPQRPREVLVPASGGGRDGLAWGHGVRPIPVGRPARRLGVDARDAEMGKEPVGAMRLHSRSRLVGGCLIHRAWERRLPSVLFRKPARAGSRPRWLSALPLITSSMAIRGVVLTAFTAPPAEAAIEKASSLTVLGS